MHGNPRGQPPDGVAFHFFTECGVRGLPIARRQSDGAARIAATHEPPVLGKDDGGQRERGVA
jgi:hypothetical protein